MKKQWIWGLLIVVLVLVVAVFRYRFRFGLSSDSPQCQSCRGQAVATYNQCLINACTSAGGQAQAPSFCSNPQNLDTYNSLVKACLAQESSSLGYCNSFYHCTSLTNAQSKSLAASPSDRTSKFDISGDWQSGPAENQNPARYHLTQQGTNLTSDGDFGHAVGHFTSPNQIVMSWQTATVTAYVNSDQVLWSNNSFWLRRGEIALSSASLDVNAGQNNGATIPDCYPAGGAQCGTLVIKDIAPGGPSGEFWGIGTPSLGQAGYEYQASYSGPLGAGYCVGVNGGQFNCNHWAIFDNLAFSKQPDGKIQVTIRFRNWASQYQKGTFAVRYWKWIPNQ
jgi:hypothetical protein